MLSNKTVIYGQWKKLSLAGESGKAWINKFLGNTNPVVLIAHTATVQTPTDDIPWASASDLDIDAADILAEDLRKSDELYPDDANDIYYATIRQPGESVELAVDFG